MGQRQSKISQDDEISEIQSLANQGGAGKVFDFIEKNLNKWKSEKILFGVTGKSATGKSSFINAYRDVHYGDPDFAMPGTGDTTKTPTQYQHPKNENIVFCDFPGYGTLEFPVENFATKMEFRKCDFFFIFFEHVFTENEIVIAKELDDAGKYFCFVRSKIDIDIAMGKKIRKSQDQIMQEIKDKAETSIKKYKALAKSLAIFYISSEKPHEVGELQQLTEFVEHKLSSIKLEAFLYSLTTMSEQVINEKYQQLKKRRFKVTVATSAISALPLPGLDVAVNIVILVNEINHYIDVFDLTTDKLEMLTGFDYSNLKCRSMLFPETNLKAVVTKELSRLIAGVTLLAAESVAEFLIPLVGSVISATTTAKLVYNFLSFYLDNFKEDACVVYKFILRHHGK